jgi:hypothetical protein
VADKSPPSPHEANNIGVVGYGCFCHSAAIPLALSFILPGWIFKFHCMAYDKREYYWNRKYIKL